MAARPFPNNLPLALSSFIGRGREIEAVKELLRAPSLRLLTLIGPGGSGKTRLALWVAAEAGPAFADGAWLVELASLNDPALVAQTVLASLGLREQAGQPSAERLAEHLAGRELLLVLDNCEHLIGACAALAEALLRAAPGLRVLVTSREPLNIAGEAVWPVPSLTLPEGPAEAPEALLRSEAVRLFVERATAAAPGFALTPANAAAVAQICRQVDGLPLALELAAARVRALSPAQIAERLAGHERFRLLSTGHRTAPPRQQTLAAALDWSYALLDEAEKRLLRRLAVFAGGFALEAVVGVAEATVDLLARLVDKSLVIHDQAGGAPRYRLLETIRQYALEKLEAAGEAAAARDAHLAYYAAWAEAAEPHMFGGSQVEWVARYAAEHDNVRVALEHSLAQPAQAGAGLRLAAACGRFWRMRGFLSEGRARLTATLAAARASAHPVSTGAVAQALYYNGGLAYLQSDYPAARALFEEALAVARSLGKAGRAQQAMTLSMLGETATEEGDYATAPRLFEEALALWRALGEKRGIADELMQLAWTGLRTGDYSQADARLRESLALFREVGDMVNVSVALAGLGEAAIRQGQYDHARPVLEESLALRRAMGDRWGAGTALGSLGWLALLQGDLDQMRAAMSESLAVRKEIGDRGGIAWCLEKLAEAVVPGQPERAVRVYGAAAALRAPVGSVIDPADRPEHEQRLAALRQSLGDAAYDAAWAAGARLPLDRIIAEALAADPVEPETGEAKDPKARFGGLTPREREVAVLIAQGKSNREIAAAMVVGLRTVETYISRILNKLNFSSRVQIATWAIEQGLVSEEA